MTTTEIIARFNDTVITYQLKRHQLFVSPFKNGNHQGVTLTERDDYGYYNSTDYVGIGPDEDVEDVARKVAHGTHLKYWRGEYLG